MSGDILRKTHNTKAWLFVSLSLLWSLVINFSPLLIGVYLLLHGEWLGAILVPILLYIVIGFYMAFWPFLAVISFIYGWMEYGFVASLVGTTLFVILMIASFWGPEWLMHKAFKAAEKAEGYNVAEQHEMLPDEEAELPNNRGQGSTCYEEMSPILSEASPAVTTEFRANEYTEEGFVGGNEEEEQMGDEILEKMAEHLEFLGYRITKKESDVFAVHPKRLNIWMRPGSGGFFLQGMYKVGEEAERDRNRFLEAINELNSKSVVVRFWTERDDKEPSLIMDTWLPRSYDKVYFGTIVDAWHHDTGTVLFQSDNMERFFDYGK